MSAAKRVDLLPVLRGLFKPDARLYNVAVKSLERKDPAVRASVDPALLGAACCFAAALIYATANLCLRWLAVRGQPIWTVCVKETVSVVIVGPWLLYGALCGRRVLPRGRALLTLVTAGLLTELGGNLLALWAMGIAGLATVVPLIVGSSLTSTAILGRVWLGERVSLRSALAIGVLILAVATLSLGATQGGVQASGTSESPQLWKILAAAGACFAGCCYSVLNVSIRRTVTADVHPTAVVFIITGIGTLTLGPLSLLESGGAPPWHTPADALGMMILCGLLNLVAFAAYTTGLRFTTAVHGNVVNTAQTALAALGGWLLFHEPVSYTILLGIALTIGGIMLVDRPVSDAAVVAEV